VIRLLARSLLERPRRTALFLLGYALGVAVVTVLLSVGEAVLNEARDKDLLGGGDVVLLPVGMDVEALKVGGATALYHRISGLRFLVRSVLTSPRVAGQVAAVCPRLVGQQVYLVARGRVTPVLAVGTVPSRERAVLAGWSWPDSFADAPEERRLLSPTPEEALREMDHFHLPPEAPGLRGAAARERGWVEWHYFEVFEPATGRFAYLSFQVLGDWRAGEALGVVSVQLGRAGRPLRRAVGTAGGARVRASLERPDLEMGAGRVRLVGSRYRVSFAVPGASGEVEFVPGAGQSFTSGEVHGDSGFVTGYAVPFVRGAARGEIRGPGGPWRFRGAVGYHDHNWGVWRDVRWNWGKVSGDSLSLVYGQILEGGRSQPGFAVLFAPGGLVGVFRPDRVTTVFGDRRVRTPAGEARLPDAVRLAAAAGERDSLRVDIRVEGGAATVLPGAPRPDAARLRRAAHVFLQLRGSYRVRAILDGIPYRVEGPGPLEVWAPLAQAGAPARGARSRSAGSR